MNRNKFIFLSRLVCLIGLSIGLYKTDYLSMVLFVLLMVSIFWIIPWVLGNIFIRDDEKQYDGEVMYKTEADGDTNCVLRIYDVNDICNRSELIIKVTDEIRSKNMPYNDEE